MPSCELKNSLLHKWEAFTMEPHPLMEGFSLYSKIHFPSPPTIVAPENADVGHICSSNHYSIPIQINVLQHFKNNELLRKGKNGY